jgi:indoleamine 2,3-dioxygenase
MVCIRCVLTHPANQLQYAALFRDYTFWASSYLLEPCNLSAMKTNDEFYGLGRDVLPVNISAPLLLLAEKLKAKPFMEYAMSYA